MSFEENFLYPLGLLIAGGAVSGIMIPWYTNRQKNRELQVEHGRADYQFKIKLKEEIIDLFQNYRQYAYHNSIVLRDAIVFHFGTVEQINQNIDAHQHHITELDFKIPDKNKMFPMDIFKNQLEKHNEEYTFNSLKYGNELESKIQWYSDNQTELKAEFNILHDTTLTLNAILVKLVQSKTQKDFVTNVNEYVKIQEIIYDLLEKFSEKLINLKIKKIYV